MLNVSQPVLRPMAILISNFNRRYTMGFLNNIYDTADRIARIKEMQRRKDKAKELAKDKLK